MTPPIWYDYQNQAWIENGLIGECGHPEPTVGCYACKHAGEIADPKHYQR